MNKDTHLPPVEYQIERLDVIIRRWWPECGVGFPKGKHKEVIDRADSMASNLGCRVRVANRQGRVIHVTR